VTPTSVLMTGPAPRSIRILMGSDLPRTPAELPAEIGVVLGPAMHVIAALLGDERNR
jgi:hypothetical protein